jgi:hypothetical protein
MPFGVRTDATERKSDPAASASSVFTGRPAPLQRTDDLALASRVLQIRVTRKTFHDARWFTLLGVKR